MSRCSWETDELARKMMEVVFTIHSEQREYDDDVDKLFEEIKLGHIVDGAIKYQDNIPMYTSRLRKDKIIRSVTDFYDTAGRLYDLSLHSSSVDWCLYRSGSQWEHFEIGDTRISPVYLSTTTALDFAALWKASKNVLFKILAPSTTELLVVESIFNPERDVVENDSYEFEVTIPPGKMTIIDKSTINVQNKDRLFVTVKFEQISREEALKLLGKMK